MMTGHFDFDIVAHVSLSVTFEDKGVIGRAVSMTWHGPLPATPERRF